MSNPFKVGDKVVRVTGGYGLSHTHREALLGYVGIVTSVEGDFIRFNDEPKGWWYTNFQLVHDKATSRPRKGGSHIWPIVAAFWLGVLAAALVMEPAHAWAPTGVPTYELPDGGVGEDGKPTVYYSVPLILADGTIEKLDVDNSAPGSWLLCRAEGEAIHCLVSVDGKIVEVQL